MKKRKKQQMGTIGIYIEKATINKYRKFAKKKGLKYQRLIRDVLNKYINGK